MVRLFFVLFLLFSLLSSIVSNSFQYLSVLNHVAVQHSEISHHEHSHHDESTEEHDVEHKFELSMLILTLSNQQNRISFSAPLMHSYIITDSHLSLALSHFYHSLFRPPIA